MIEINCNNASSISLIIVTIRDKILEIFNYGSNSIAKKEPKSDDRLSKFDWYDLLVF